MNTTREQLVLKYIYEIDKGEKSILDAFEYCNEYITDVHLKDKEELNLQRLREMNEYKKN